MKVNLRGQIVASYANAFNSFLQLQIYLFIYFYPFCVIKQIISSSRKEGKE